MQIIVFVIPAIGLYIHFFQKASSSPLIKWYLTVVWLMEFLNMTVHRENLYLFGIAPLVNTIFYVEIQKDFLKLRETTLLLLRFVAVVIAILLFPFSLSVEHFKAYSGLFFHAIIVFINLSFLYASVSKKMFHQQSLYFHYASLFFFSIDLFLAISSNFLVNAAIHLVFVLWFIRFLFLLWYYYAVIRFAHD